MTEIQKLYAIERRAREGLMDTPTIMKLRKQESIPILDALKSWRDREYDQVLPASTMGKAITYTLKCWDGLSVYASTGHLQIDNNKIENLIRPLALGGKNYLFAGSHDGARRAATFYALFATCKLNDVNPYRWLRDVLMRIQEHPVNRLNELLPL